MKVKTIGDKNEKTLKNVFCRPLPSNHRGKPLNLPPHLGGGRPLFVRLRLPPSPTRRTRPFCRFATFSPFHRGHLPVSSGEHSPKEKAKVLLKIKKPVILWDFFSLFRCLSDIREACFLLFYRQLRFFFRNFR